MEIGIDGNMWYCSNGICLGDPRAKFTFERTLREAAAAHRIKFKHNNTVPDELAFALDLTPEEYKATPQPEDK